MTTLEKARLQEITSDRAARPIGDPVEVQFNPTSLKLKLSNNSEGGRSRGRQTRQHMGVSSTTLAMDLIFDTADEGQTDQPRSVHEKTALVEKYVLPKENGDAPPKLRFQWGNLLMDGVVESLDIEFDHFAAHGVPLRAKVSLSIKGQDPKYEFLEAGPGARDNSATREPGAPAADEPGARGGPSNRFQPALQGETPQEFAARMGLNPTAWRGLSTPELAEGLTLSAGAQVGFSASLAAGAGVGVRLGVAATAEASLESSLGLAAATGARASLRQGHALAAAGGLTAAVETLDIIRSRQAAQATRDAFAHPAASSQAASSRIASRESTSLPAAVSTAASADSLGSTGSRSALQPGPPADTRAVSYGLGVPLREQVGGRRTGPVVLTGPAPQQSAQGSQPPLTRDPTTPPWVQLPWSSGVDIRQARRPPASSSGCRCAPDGGGSHES